MVIYCLKCTVNNKTYVGQTVNLGNRKSAHLYALRRDKHPNKLIQADFNLYGEERFIFEVLEEFDSGMNFNPDNLERYWIERLKTTNPEHGYNKTNGGKKDYQYTEQSTITEAMTEASNERWKGRPNKGISPWKIGDKAFRITLTVNSKQKTVGYAYSFDEARRMYFEAYIDAFGERPSGLYDEKLLTIENGQKYTSRDVIK